MPERPPHANVKWKYRTTTDSEYWTHYDGPWTVRVQDCDGDRAVWRVERDGVEYANGEVSWGRGVKRSDTDIAADAALACLAALKAEPHEEDH